MSKFTTKLVDLEIRLWIWAYQSAETIASRVGRFRPVVAGLARAAGLPVDAWDDRFIAAELVRTGRM